MRLRMPDARMCVYAIVGAVGLAAWVAGVSSSAVVATMNRRKASAECMAELMRDPRNAECVEAKRRNVTSVKREYAAVHDYVAGLNGRRPLIEGVLPAPRSDAERYRFAESYAAAIVALVKQLGAAGRAGPPEIEAAQREVDELRAWLAEQDADEPPENRIVQRPLVAGNRVSGTNRSATKRGDPKFDAELRAQVERARDILCYAEPESFHISPVIHGLPPSMEEIWHAQVGLWIQQDLVAAIAKLNAEAADTCGGKDAHVQHSPVKRIVKVEILGYRGDGATIPFASIDDRRSSVPAAERLVFTPYSSGGDVDVVRFRVWLIVDQRDLLQVVDRITGENLYRCANLSFTTAADQRDAGYLYGSEPVVCVEMKFEAFFVRDFFEPLMPEEVLRRMGARGDNGG